MSSHAGRSKLKESAGMSMRKFDRKYLQQLLINSQISQLHGLIRIKEDQVEVGIYLIKLENLPDFIVEAYFTDFASALDIHIGYHQIGKQFLVHIVTPVILI